VATIRAVLDTNVLVSAIRSKLGASLELLSEVGAGAFDIVVSVPLVFEYEDALLRNRGRLSEANVRQIVDYLCAIAVPQPIFFLWRPMLRDPKDDMVAEVAFASSCDYLVTHNRKDFSGVETLGVRVVSPAQFLERIGKS